MKLLPRPTPVPRSNDDNLGRGMEFALITLVFLGLGLAVDSALGTRPAFAIGCVVFAFVAQFVRMYYVYTARMERLEAERSASLRSGDAPRAAVTPVTPPVAGTLPTGVVLDQPRDHVA